MYTPFNLFQLRKNKPLSFKEDYFFSQLAIESGHLSNDTVRQVYFGLVKHLSKELAKNNFVRAPHLGDFGLIKRKQSVMLAGKQKGTGIANRVYSEPISLKFFACDDWRKHFSLLNKGNE